MNPLASLTDARAKAVPWRSVAARLLKLETSAPLAADGQPWIKAAEAASGYSVNHLRRMSRALTLMGDIERLWPQHIARLARLSFTHAEILARIWEADRREVERLLDTDGWPSYAQLLVLYEKARSRRAAPGAAGKLAAGKFRTHVRELLHRQYGPALREPVPHHPYLKPDFLVVNSPRMVVAWDCLLLPGKIDEDALRRRFLTWATEASFVTIFWIVTQDGSGETVMGRCIGELELANIGLMATDKSQLTALIEPKGPPMPDRRNAAITASQW